MPDVVTKIGILSFRGEYKPGDPPPTGYLDWHAWAEVQHKARLKQVRCGICGLFRFPQELSGRLIESESRSKKRGGQKVVMKSPVCKGCDQPADPKPEVPK